MKKLRKYSKPIIKNEIIVPKQTHFTSYILAFVAVISLVLTAILTYKVVFPKPDLKIIESPLCFDGRAIQDTAYLDSLYLELQLYNDGNKSTSVSKIRFFLEDPEDSTIIIKHYFISRPKLINAGETSTSLIKILPRRIGSYSQTTKNTLYTLPYKSEHDSWKKLSYHVGVILDLHLKRKISFKTEVYYGDNNIVEKAIIVNNIKAVDPNYYIE